MSAKKVTDRQLIESVNANLTQTQIAKKFGINKGGLGRRLKALGIHKDNLKNKIERQQNRVAIERGKLFENQTIDLIQQLHRMISSMNRIREDNEADTAREIELLEHLHEHLSSPKSVIASKQERETLAGKIRDAVKLISENKRDRQQIIINAVKAETPLLTVARELQSFLAQVDAIQYAIKYLLDEVEQVSPELRERVARRLYEAERARNMLPPDSLGVVTQDSRAPQRPDEKKSG